MLDVIQLRIFPSPTLRHKYQKWKNMILTVIRPQYENWSSSQVEETSWRNFKIREHLDTGQYKYLTKNLLIRISQNVLSVYKIKENETDWTCSKHGDSA
jgi:hypothetical protein